MVNGISLATDFKKHCGQKANVTEVKHGCAQSETMGELPDKGPKELTPPSFGKDLKLGVPCLKCGMHSRPKLAEKAWPTQNKGNNNNSNNKHWTTGIRHQNVRLAQHTCIAFPAYRISFPSEHKEQR